MTPRKEKPMITHCPNCGGKLVGVTCFSDDQTDSLMGLVKDITGVWQTLDSAYEQGLLSRASTQAAKREMLNVLFASLDQPAEIDNLLKPRARPLE